MKKFKHGIAAFLALAFAICAAGLCLPLLFLNSKDQLLICASADWGLLSQSFCENLQHNPKMLVSSGRYVGPSVIDTLKSMYAFRQSDASYRKFTFDLIDREVAHGAAINQVDDNHDNVLKVCIVYYDLSCLNSMLALHADKGVTWEIGGGRKEDLYQFIARHDKSGRNYDGFLRVLQ